MIIDKNENLYFSKIYDIVYKQINKKIIKIPEIDVKYYKIDLQSKITHLITSDNYIYPIEPIHIFSDDLNIIYNFDKIKLHNYENTITFLKKINKIITGIIVENKHVVNILLKDSYIPIEPELYDKKIHKYKIKGELSLFKLDLLLSNNIEKTDNRTKYSDIFNYEMKMNTYLIIIYQFI